MSSMEYRVYFFNNVFSRIVIIYRGEEIIIRKRVCCLKKVLFWSVYGALQQVFPDHVYVFLEFLE